MVEMSETSSVPASHPVPAPPALTGAQVRALKSRAQTLEPILRLGHAGASPAFIQSLDVALADHELVKIKFTDFKDQRKVLSRELAEATGSTLIWVVGHVAVFYRKRPTP